MGSAEHTMRLDRFLWFARIAKTRDVAQAMATSGRLRIDGRAIEKASTSVRIGCVIAFATPGGQVRALRVEALPPRRGAPQEGRACYSELIENGRSARASVDDTGARA